MSIIGRIGILLVALIATPAASAATVWHVAAGAPGPGTLPNSYPTIQAALDAASSGDEIIVTPGLYFERLDFLGKNVLLRSSAGPDVTIVDAGGSGSVVTFAHGEGPAAVLRGFTLRHGDGTGSWPHTDGGGIYCKDASPTIEGNVIEQCQSGFYGGGLVLYGGTPVVTGNTVRDNHAGSGGGGIYCAAGTSATIVGNTIRSNDTAGGGGGIAVDDTAMPTIQGNLVEENVAGGAAGIDAGWQSTLPVVVRGNVIRGNSTDEDWVGGLQAAIGTLVEDNDIIDNRAFGPGAGVSAWGSTLRNNRITGNDGWFGAAVWGREGTTFEGDLIEDNTGVEVEGTQGGVPARLTRVTIIGTTFGGPTEYCLVASGQVVFEDCLIAGNAVGVQVYGSTTLHRCTLAGNEGSAVMALSGGHATLEGCIAWGNALATGLELMAEPGSSLDASWSIVRLGYPGTGNLDVDPLFADAPAGDYALRPGSPAIDSGNPAEGVCGFDLTGMPRRLDGLLDGGSRVDRGALEFGNGRLSHTFPLDGVLEIELQGTAGLPAALLVGLLPGQACLEKWGTLGVDLAAPSLVLPWPGAPSVVQTPVPASLSGLTVVLQALVGSPGLKAGNLTNVAAVPMP